MNSSLEFAIKHDKKVLIVYCFDPDERKIRFLVTSSKNPVAGAKGPALYRMQLTYNQAERLCSSLRQEYLVKYWARYKSHYLLCEKKESPNPYHFRIGVCKVININFGLSMEEVHLLCDVVLGYLGTQGFDVDTE